MCTRIYFRCTNNEIDKRPKAEDIYNFLSTLMEVVNVNARDDSLEIDFITEAAKSMSVSPSQKDKH